MDKDTFDYNNIHRFVYCTNHPINQHMSKYLAVGFSAQPVYSQRVYDRHFKDLIDVFPLYQGLSICYGLLRGTGAVMRECSANQLPYLYVDHSFFFEKRSVRTDKGIRFDGYYRCIKNGRYTNEGIDRPADRFNELGIEVQPWRDDGDHIVVAPLSKHVAKHNSVDADLWLRNTMETLAQYTKRPIVVKPKDSDLPLREALKNAWALVTLDSNSAVDAAVQGVPVFCSPHAAAAPIANFSFADIEDPQTPDRQQWLNNLAYQQFTLSEIEDGTAARILYKEIQDGTMA